MKKNQYFSGPAEYDQKRPYCVVYPAPHGYEIDKRFSTRKAAQNACERGSLYAEVKTITEVNRANKAGAEAEQQRLLGPNYYPGFAPLNQTR
ncbi:MAG: hypothetical protein NVS3B25_18940 [Hymenobacter sp.]